jgi:PleD family two-component response regulator
MPVPSEIGPNRPLILVSPCDGDFVKAVRSATRAYAPVLDIQQAPDLVTALLRLGVEKPEMFLLSVGPSEFDPIDVVKSIRKNPGTRPVRVGVFGSSSDNDKLKVAMRAGAAESVTSPESLGELLQRLADLYDGKSQRRFRLRRISQQ